MHLVSYRVRGSNGPWRAGVERSRTVVDISRYPSFQKKAMGEEQSLSMRTVLDQGQQVLTGVLAWASSQLDAGQDALSLDSLELGPPMPDPDKFLCLGVNYLEHAAETNMEVPSVPTIFAKFRNCLVGPAAPILLPSVSKAIDYEGELAVIIGTRCKNVSENDALQYVAGYTVCNDVTARDIQIQTSQWTAGKALDTFAPMGPGIVPASEIADPQALELTTRLNGHVVQHNSTANMVFSVAAAIAFLSSLMTLEPGDIIATGTPSGVGFRRNPPLFMQHGDVVEVEIERIGTIRNPVLNARAGQ